MRIRLAHRLNDFIARDIELDDLAREFAVRIRKVVQEDDQSSFLRIITVLAAFGHLSAFHAMIIEAREPLEETQILETLPWVDDGGIGINSRRYVPMLLREARDDLVFERVVVGEEKVQRGYRGEYDQGDHTDQRDLEDGSERHQMIGIRSAPLRWVMGAATMPPASAQNKSCCRRAVRE